MINFDMNQIEENNKKIISSVLSGELSHIDSDSKAGKAVTKILRLNEKANGNGEKEDQANFCAARLKSLLEENKTVKKERKSIKMTEAHWTDSEVNGVTIKLEKDNLIRKPAIVDAEELLFDMDANQVDEITTREGFGKEFTYSREEVESVVFKGSLTDYIDEKYKGNKSEFAKSQNVKPQQITEWVNKEFIVIDGVLYSPRRSLET